MPITIGPDGVKYNDGALQSSGVAQSSDSGDLISITAFTATGTYTVPANCKSLLVKVVGGGGGSAGYLESGGAGGYSEKLIQGLSPGATVTVTVGGGGGGVGYYAAAGDGGTSSFGSYCSATGGYGANRNHSHTGGHGGIGSGGDVNFAGAGGYGHGNTISAWGAKGTASYWGGGFGTRHSGGETIGSGAPGTGASPGTTGGTAGKTAAAGMVVVYAYT